MVTNEGCADRQVREAPPEGAGDAFVGALAACMRDGSSVLQAATFAVSAAALSVTRPGTLDAFATHEMVAASLGIATTQEASKGRRPTRT